MKIRSLYNYREFSFRSKKINDNAGDRTIFDFFQSSYTDLFWFSRMNIRKKGLNRKQKDVNHLLFMP